jgi:hypothetical protein
VLHLIVARRGDSERSENPGRDLVDRYQIDPVGLLAEDREIVHFPVIVTPNPSGIAVVPVAATDIEENRARPQPTRLALHSADRVSVVDEKVVAGVLSKRN